MRQILTPSTVPWVLFACAAAPVLAWRSTGFPNLFLEDDAYFYLQIAWNIGTGHGSTFDGLTITNGYHLLWMGLLSVLAWVVASLGFGKAAMVVLVSLAGVSLAATSAVGAFRSTAERIFYVVLALFCGATMEGTLVAALCLLAMRAFLDDDASLPVTLGAAFLLPLARIDYGWVAPALALICLGDRGRMQRLPLLPIAAAAALGAATHFAVERAMFGTWTTVSSAYKAELFTRSGAFRIVPNLANRANQIRYACAALCGIAIGAQAWRLREGRTALAFGVALAPLMLYSVVNAMRDWYFLPGLAMLLLLASRACTHAPRAWRTAVAIQASVIAIACVMYLIQVQPDWQRTSAFVSAARATLTSADVVYQIDGSGFTGWTLPAHVVNGDGLVNSWSYRERLRANALGSYLRDVRATHIIDNRESVDPLLQYHGLVVRADQATLEADTGQTRNGAVHYRLFRLK